MKMNMNWDGIAGKWKQYSGEVKKKWGKLTDDELLQVNGNRDILAGKIQEKYGIARDEANKQIDEWADKLSTSQICLFPLTLNPSPSGRGT